MKSYFIRHTKGMAVVEDAIDYLWKQDKIAIHFPFEDETKKHVEDSTSVDEKDYKKTNAKRAISTFSELNTSGGYIWAEYRNRKYAKVGKIVPESFEIYVTKWLPGRFTYERKAKLKTLQIDRKSVKVISPSKAMSLRAARPRQGTIRRWPSVKDRLKCLVEEMPIAKSWDSLFPSEQETVCCEYLRHPDVTECPTLKRLLLPVGRTLEDVDIFGYAVDGKNLFAQVTYYKKARAKKKIRDLKKYDNLRSHLVFFCDCEEIEFEDNILFIPIERVERLLKNDELYMGKLFAER